MAHLSEENGQVILRDDWHIDDILMVREDLTEDQAIDVLEFLANAFDANEGINWDVIEYACQTLYPKKGD